ncbi:hypothetical protein [Alkalinema sp. FACHB-956]|uniref:hypothetical protein n=1 Tax=Alkalinema sp. FACHB-956 TaxID=2692768 RepID=UPI0016884F3F|nr:hypothetical protein [Alkalinema sp. FACHB-956]MBD2327133.1 hypothetical protein [Alkalinema sp. FACHB-956]
MTRPHFALSSPTLFRSGLALIGSSVVCSSLVLLGAVQPTLAQTNATPIKATQTHVTNALSPETLLGLTPIATSIAQSKLPNEVISAIQTDLQQRFGVEKIQVVSYSEQQWPDGCLGLAKMEPCTLATVLGWQVTVSHGTEQNWVYRTDRTGNIVRLEDPMQTTKPAIPQPTGLSKQVAAKLLRQVSRDTRIPRGKLKIAEVKEAGFDGCLGIYRPNQACTKIFIQGWQAIVTGPNRSFVYHLDQSGDRIAQNSTASGAMTPPVRVSFELLGGDQAPTVESNVVFRSTVSGGLAGMVTTVTLTEDGKVTEWTVGPTIKSRPVVRKTLTPKQVAEFKQSLEQARFPNLNGLSYLTSAALADYPTTTYQTQYAMVQLIDLEVKSMPRSLQQVYKRWETLVK